MPTVKITTEFITLGQLLKFENIISNGSEAKAFILNNDIFVNKELCKQRGKKIYPDYIVDIPSKNITIKVCKQEN